MKYLTFISSLFLLVAPCQAAAESTSNIDVYIMKAQIDNYTSDVESVIGKKSIYGFNSMYWKGAKTKNARGTYEPITMSKMVRVYDKDTVQYAYDNCNYEKSPKKCTNQNGNYLVETIITIDEHETVVQMILYNPDMTVLNVSTVSDRGEINYIRQQEIQMSMTSSRVDVKILPEQKPLKWVIPAHLLEGYVRQAAKGLWLGIRI